jgi:hypothetical protein
VAIRGGGNDGDVERGSGSGLKKPCVTIRFYSDVQLKSCVMLVEIHRDPVVECFD